MWFSLGLCGLSLIIIDYASFDKSTRKAISHDNCHQDKCHQIKKVEEQHSQSRFWLVLPLHYQLCWKPHKSSNCSTINNVAVRKQTSQELQILFLGVFKSQFYQSCLNRNIQTSKGFAGTIRLLFSKSSQLMSLL